MNRLTNVSVLSLSVALFVGGCGAKEPPPAPPPPPTVAPTPPPEPPAPPALPAVEFVAGTAASAPDKAPTLTFSAPLKDQLIAPDKAGDFAVKMDLKGWDVPGGGNHVHLILDGKPYKRIDDPKAPVKLKELDASIGEGQHVLVAFPSRPTHESVKSIGKASPLAVVAFFVGKKKGDVVWKPTDPTLVYSRPKGENNGPPPAEGILVDYYLANAELGEGKFSIEATLMGPGLETAAKVTIKQWTPWRITNVRDGKYTLQMTLLDASGKPVPGAWNAVSRDFTVDVKADPDHAHALGAPKPGSAPPAPAPSAAPSATP